MDIRLIILLTLIDLISCRIINNEGFEIIKKYEGFHSKFYEDSYGVKSIGFGHRCLKDICNTIIEPISQELAEMLLRIDLEPYQECVEHYAPGLNDDQFSALVSFSWTMGCASLRTSILLHQIKSQNYMEASNEFNKFISSKGEEDQHLPNRRKAEKELFCKGGGCKAR